MFDSRSWVSNLLLRSPASLRSIRNVPVLGDVVHRISRRVVSSDETVWAKVQAGPCEGLWMRLNPRTGQGYLRGEAEPAVQKVLAERLQPSMVFYDLGANLGFFSMLAARIVGPSGIVFSFEPDPEIAGRLQKNIERNGLRNVRVIPKGVWSESGKQAFVSAGASSPDRGTGRFVADSERAGSASLECVALDDFVRAAPAPHAIKCDVEGAEVDVLRGAQQLLRAYRPWILCEMHSQPNDSGCREILERFGYNFTDVDELHVLATPQGA